MQWFLIILAILTALGGGWFYRDEQNARRAIQREELAVADKNADTERMKAENTAKRLENDRLRALTALIETEFKYSRDPKCSSTTLELEQQRDQRRYEAELAPAGSPENPDKI